MSDFIDSNLYDDLDAAVAAADTLSPAALAEAARNTIEMHQAQVPPTRHGVIVPVTFSGIY